MKVGFHRFWYGVLAVVMLGAGFAPLRAHADDHGLTGRLAFISGHNIAVLDLQTGTSWTIWSAPTDHGAGPPQWSPNGSALAFEGPDGNAWVISADGANAHALTDQAIAPSGCDEGGCAAPGIRIDSLRWSPDGTRLSYRLVEQLAAGSIWWVAREGTERGQIATAPDLCLFNEGWTPDGVPLVSRCATAGGLSNATYRAMGDRLQLAVTGSQLAYSADGRQLAYANHTLTPQGIAVTLMIAHADGSQLEAVAPDGQEPCWSAAGLVAYQRAAVDGWHLRVFDPATRRDTDLGVGELNAWSGDGQWLFYTVLDDTGGTIWRVHPDGSGVAPVAPGRFAAWALQ